jgi:hypothetical protein
MRSLVAAALLIACPIAALQGCSSDESTPDDGTSPSATGTGAASSASGSSVGSGAGGTSGTGASAGSTSSTGGTGGVVVGGAGGAGGAGATGGDGGQTAGGGGEAIADACESCWEGPGETACEPAIDACHADPSCDIWFNCVEECFDRDYNAPCWTMCKADTDVAAYEPVYTCLCSACANVCVLPCTL